MGYGWSSAVAQDVTLGALLATGLDEQCVVSPDYELPACQDELAIGATDDVVFFHKGSTQAGRLLHAYDGIMQQYNIPKASHKHNLMVWLIQ